MKNRCPKCYGEIGTAGICTNCGWWVNPYPTSHATTPVKIEYQAANRLIEWSKALDRLIQVAEKVYTIADVLLKMDMAFGEFGDLGRIKLVQELGDTLDEVKRLRGE